MNHDARRGYYPGGSAGGAHYEYPTLGDRASSPTNAAAGRRRLPSLSSLSSARAGERSQSSSYVVTRRMGQGRRLPATPTHPSTLNIDSLANVSSSSQQQTGSGTGVGGGGGERINFPKLNPSPSRPAIRTGAGVVSRAGANARLPQVPSTSAAVAGPGHGAPSGATEQGISLRNMMLGRGAVEPEETVAVMSGRGRGGRQLPRVGPEHLASADSGGIMGRGGASSGGMRRELPRPGTTIGFSNVGSHGYPMDHRRSIGGSRISDTDEEDWC